MPAISARARLTAPAAFFLQPPAARPNILLLVADDLNTDLGCYGHPLVRTPNLDRLARRGVRFDRAYTQYPVCNPTRTSFLSGRYPESTGVLDNRRSPHEALPGVTFLPEYLRRAGYFTARISKIFHDGMDGPNDWDLSLDSPRPTEAGLRGEGRNLTGGKFAFFRWMAAEGADSDQPDGGTAAEAVRFLERPPRRPFFLAVGLRKPHDPYVAPAKYFEPYPLDLIPPPPHPPDDERDIPPAAYPPVRHNLGPQEGREFRRAYAACTSFMDAQAGKILDALDRTGLAQNTVVVFFGDHGLHLGEHGWWNKVTLFERSARVPLLVAGPAVAQPGEVCRRPVELLGLFPTLSELAGKPAPAQQGASWLPLLRDPHAPWTRPAYTVVTRGKALGRALRTERWRYTEWDSGRDGVELYDHHSDPHEYTNLAQEPAFAAVVRALKDQLARTQAHAASLASK